MHHAGIFALPPSLSLHAIANVFVGVFIVTAMLCSLMNSYDDVPWNAVL